MKHVSCAYKRATECITKINTPFNKQQPFHCLQRITYHNGERAGYTLNTTPQVESSKKHEN